MGVHLRKDKHGNFHVLATDGVPAETGPRARVPRGLWLRHAPRTKFVWDGCWITFERLGPGYRSYGRTVIVGVIGCNFVCKERPTQRVDLRAAVRLDGEDDNTKHSDVFCGCDI